VTTYETYETALRTRAWRRVRRRPALFYIGLSIVVSIVLLALAAPLLSQWGPTEIDFNAIDSAPGTADHVLGTDQNGMDLWSRVLHAARLDLGVAVAAVSIAVLVGGVLGAAIGYARGWVDEVGMRVVDVVQSFPAFVLALAVATLLGTGTGNLIAVIALVNTPSYIRLMRSEVRSTREHGYVEAARCSGESEASILFRHVVPNSLRPLLVIAPLNCGWAILTLAGLSFLGLGVQIPEPEWGAMIAAGSEDMVSGRWWSSVVPGVALFVTVLGFNLLGEALLDALDEDAR
jgi:peptide/nickel transport system permease protein